MEQNRLSRSSVESVESMLSNYSTEGPKDRTGLTDLLRNARELVERYAQVELKGHKIKADIILYALMDHAIDPEGQRYVASVVSLAKNEADPAQYLEILARVWLTHLLFPVKALGRKREGTSTEDQTPTFNATVTAALIERATRGDQSALRLLLRRRQGEQCVVTGAYTDESYTDELAAVRGYGTEYSHMRAAHILPLALNTFDDKKRAEVVKFAITWDMICSWGSFDILKLAGAEMSGAAYALLVRADLATRLGKFLYWFESTGKENTYNVVPFPNRGMSGVANNKLITFVNHDATPIDLPDPQILALHAAFAKVFYASGAGEYIEAYWREMDSIHVLSTDGGTDLESLNISLQRFVIA